MIPASRRQIRGEDCVRDCLDRLQAKSIKHPVEASVGIGIIVQRVADAHHRVESTVIRQFVELLDGTYPRGRYTLAFDHEGVHSAPMASMPGVNGHCGLGPLRHASATPRRNGTGASVTRHGSTASPRRAEITAGAVSSPVTCSSVPKDELAVPGSMCSSGPRK